MTRRYTRETARRVERSLNTFSIVRAERLDEAYMQDGTSVAGNAYRFPSAEFSDMQYAHILPLLIARGEVTPVPVDINQEAAKFARAKKR